MTGFFGPDDADAVPHEVDLGDGHRLVFDREALERLLRLPQVAAAVEARADALCDTANSMVDVAQETVDRLGGMPAYQVTMRNDDEHGPRAYVHPKYAEHGESLGFVDDAANSTLFKAALQHSDEE